MKIDELRTIVSQYLAENNLSQNKIASTLQIQQASLHRFLKGQSGVSYEMALKLLALCGYSIQKHLAPVQDQSKEVRFVNAKVINAGEHLPPIIPDDYLAVPLCMEAGAGAGIVQYDAFQSWFLVYRNEPSIRMRSNLIAVKIAKGSTSMLPTLAPDDIVLVDRSENTSPRPGRIYLVADPDGATKVKRVTVTIDKTANLTRITFYSDNVAEYPPETYYMESDYEDDITRAIMGRVVWAWSDVSTK